MTPILEKSKTTKRYDNLTILFKIVFVTFLLHINGKLQLSETVLGHMLRHKSYELVQIIMYAKVVRNRVVSRRRKF